MLSFQATKIDLYWNNADKYRGLIQKQQRPPLFWTVSAATKVAETICRPLIDPILFCINMFVLVHNTKTVLVSGSRDRRVSSTFYT